jgi:hypothetical protein
MVVLLSYVDQACLLSFVVGILGLCLSPTYDFNWKGHHVAMEEHWKEMWGSGRLVGLTEEAWTGLWLVLIFSPLVVFYYVTYEGILIWLLLTFICCWRKLMQQPRYRDRLDRMEIAIVDVLNRCIERVRGKKSISLMARGMPLFEWWFLTVFMLTTMLFKAFRQICLAYYVGDKFLMNHESPQQFPWDEILRERQMKFGLTQASNSTQLDEMYMPKWLNGLAMASPFVGVVAFIIFLAHFTIFVNSWKGVRSPFPKGVTVNVTSKRFQEIDATVDQVCPTDPVFFYRVKFDLVAYLKKADINPQDITFRLRKEAAVTVTAKNEQAVIPAGSEGVISKKAVKGNHFEVMFYGRHQGEKKEWKADTIIANTTPDAKAIIHLDDMALNDINDWFAEKDTKRSGRDNPWKADPQDELACLVVMMPAAFVVLSMTASVRLLQLMTFKCVDTFCGCASGTDVCDQPGDWNRFQGFLYTTATTDLEIATAFQYLTVFAFGLLVTYHFTGVPLEDLLSQAVVNGVSDGKKKCSYRIIRIRIVR